MDELGASDLVRTRRSSIIMAAIRLDYGATISRLILALRQKRASDRAPLRSACAGREGVAKSGRANVTEASPPFQRSSPTHISPLTKLVRQLDLSRSLLSHDALPCHDVWPRGARSRSVHARPLHHVLPADPLLRRGQRDSDLRWTEHAKRNSCALLALNTSMEINSGHETATVQVLISFDAAPTTFFQFSNGSTLPLVRDSFQVTEGSACFFVDVSKAITTQTIKNGTEATLMVRYSGGDGDLYQCSDVVLVSDYAAPSNSTTCAASLANTIPAAASGSAAVPSASATKPASSADRKVEMGALSALFVAGAALLL